MTAAGGGATLSDRLAAYLTRVRARETSVEGLARISGGASRETYRFDAMTGGRRESLILRRDPPGSLIETDRRLEFLAIRSFEGKGVAAPRTVALEVEGAELERPFFIMERLDGGTGSIFGAEPYGQHAAAIGEAFFTMLGKIAGEPVEGLPINEAADCPQPADCWRRELDYWSEVIDADEEHPQPIVRAAFRRLRRAPPAPAAKIAVVHGDYRSGNFLHDGKGAIVAVLDWEMAHLGDPLEDLAWAMDPLWRKPGDGRVSGMIGEEEAIVVWSAASGLKVDRPAFEWWRLFASVKAQAIWISSAKAWKEGGFTEPILAFSGWYTARRQDEILAERLAAIGGLT
jgi:aminoglycoside phosphotransferase (APT) family kinase protein